MKTVRFYQEIAWVGKICMWVVHCNNQKEADDLIASHPGKEFKIWE